MVVDSAPNQYRGIQYRLEERPKKFTEQTSWVSQFVTTMSLYFVSFLNCHILGSIQNPKMSHHVVLQ